MDILKEVKDILALQNPYEKDDRLEQLSDVLEYHHRLNQDLPPKFTLFTNFSRVKICRNA